MPSTVQFHRVLRATPERVYRAFVDPDAKLDGLPGEMTVTVRLKKVSVGTEVNIVQEGSRTRSRRTRARSAGRSPSPCWRNLSSRRFRTDR